MTRYDFARHFKTVCNVLGVWEYDEPDADAAALDAAAARVWKLWLIPTLFDGFDPAEWGLSDTERALVCEQSGRYSAVAERVAATGGVPTAADFATGRDALRAIFPTLRRWLFNANGFHLVRDLRRIALDPKEPSVRRWVRAVDISLGTDYDGDPVASVWLLIPDEAIDDSQFWTEWEPLDKRVRDRLSARAEDVGVVFLSLRGLEEAASRMSGVPA